MRIAMFMPGLAPNALGWVVHSDFAAAVEARGHPFELLTTPSPGEPPSDDAVARVLPAPERWQRLAPWAAPFLRTRQLLPAWAALARHLQQRGDSIDLLHIEVAYPHGAAAALAVKSSGWKGPLAISPMGEDVLVVDDAAYGFRRYPVPRVLVAWTLRRAACIRSISPMFDRRIAALAPDSRRRIIPLSISTATAALSEESDERLNRRRSDARESLDSQLGASDRPIILALGRLHPFKGLEVLVDALVHVPDALLLIVGPSLQVRGFGDEAERLLNRAAARDVSDRVRYRGAVAPEQAASVLAAADVVAVPSHLESLNKVCVEAAATGTPFVVTETTGISAWVPDQGVGLVVPPPEIRLPWAGRSTRS